jgi:hypothetical protein
LFQEQREAVALEASVAKLRRLDSRMPPKNSGKNAFVQELVSLACSDSFRRCYAPGATQQEAVSKHGALWRALGAAQALVYKEKGRQLVRLQEQELENARAAAREEVRTRRAAWEAAKRRGAAPLRLGACCLGEMERLEFDALWWDPRFGERLVCEAQELEHQVVQPLSPEDHSVLLASRQLPREAARAPPPPWLGEMAQRRGALEHAVLEVVVGPQTRWFKFLYAVLSPSVFVALQELVREDEELFAAVALHLAPPAPAFEHCFLYVPGRLVRGRATGSCGSSWEKKTGAAGTGARAAPSPCDCNQDGVDRWSLEKRVWCCQHYRAAAAGFPNSKAGWSWQKKDWCCRNRGKGCPEPLRLQPGRR